VLCGLTAVYGHFLGTFFSTAIELQEFLSSDSEVENNSCRFFETPITYEKVPLFSQQLHDVLITCGFVPGLLLCTQVGTGKWNLIITTSRIPHPTE
jgi:hypothetical protein